MSSLFVCLFHTRCNSQTLRASNAASVYKLYCNSLMCIQFIIKYITNLLYQVMIIQWQQPPYLLIQKQSWDYKKIQYCYVILLALLTNINGIPHVSKSPHRSSCIWVIPHVSESGCGLLFISQISYHDKIKMYLVAVQFNYKKK